jgi:hypothetical protein
MEDKILFGRVSMISLHCVHLARVVRKNEAKLTNVLASRGIRNLGASGGRHMLVFFLRPMEANLFKRLRSAEVNDIEV